MTASPPHLYPDTTSPLLPCPFCGSSDIMDGVYYADGALEKRGAVRCADCGVRAPTASWNKRTAHPGPVAQTEKVPDEDQEYAETMHGVAQQLRMLTALESIAGWRKVNIQAEYEHGLRDIIRSITDCAAAALDACSVSSTESK